ncbi:MAG: ferrous iron transport protein A [Legionella sp.]|nr:MAG: ferrous iron transport protein A [Legionella sp.]PJD98004.1 MAG: ferrous iron transport protein A [Legionella sp.]
MASIIDLIPGDKVRVLDFGVTEPAYKRRLLSLGLTRGVAFRFIRKAPLGCPVQIEVRGTSLTLRKEEALHLVLERL